MKENEISKLYKDLKPQNGLTKSYDFLFNNSKPKNTMKTFFIRKITETDPLNEKIDQEYTNYFFNPDTYFTSNSPLRLNKKHEITDISLELKSNKKLMTKRNNMLNISSASRKKSIATKDKDKYGNFIIDNTKFEYIDNKRLGNIFNSYKDIINSKTNKSYFKYNKNLPLNISSELNNQNKSKIQY